MKSNKIPKLVVYDNFVDKDEQIQFVETARNLLKQSQIQDTKPIHKKLNLNQFKVLQEHNSNKLPSKYQSNANIKYLNLNCQLKKENQQARSRTPIRHKNQKESKSPNTSFNQFVKISRSPSPIKKIINKVYNSDDIQYQECQQRIEKIKQQLTSNYKKLQYCEQKLIKEHFQSKTIRDQKKLDLDLLEKDNLEMQLKMYQNMYEVCIDNYIKSDEIKKKRIHQSQHLEKLNQIYQENQKKIEELQLNVQRHEVLIQPDIDKQNQNLEEQVASLQQIKQKNYQVQNEIDRKQNIILMVHQDIQYFNGILKQKMDLVNFKRNKILGLQQQIDQSQQAINTSKQISQQDIKEQLQQEDQQLQN